LLLAVIGAMQMSYRVLARAIIQEECPDHLIGPGHEPVLSRPRFWLSGRALDRQRRRIFPVPFAVAGSAVACGLVSWFVPRAARDAKVLALNDSTVLL
jgi:hypothetical protein